MDKITSNMAVVLLIIVITSTIITTFTFFQMDTEPDYVYYMGSDAHKTATGKVSINILNENYPVEREPVSTGPEGARVAINIK